MYHRHNVLTSDSVSAGVPALFPVVGLTTLATGENYLILTPDEENDIPG